MALQAIMAKVEKSYEALKDLMIREKYIESCPKELAVFLRERALVSLVDVAQLADKHISAHSLRLGQ